MNSSASSTGLKQGEDLLRRAKSGDQRAMDKVIKQHQDVARNIVRGYNAPGMEREDLLQYANIGIWRAVNVYVPGKGCFKSLAGLIARRYVQDALRKANACKCALLNEASSIYVEGDDGTLEESWILADSAANPEMIVIANQENEEILQSLRRELTNLEYWTAVFWSHRQSLQDAVDCLGISKKTADNAIKRVKRKALQIQGNLDVTTAEAWSHGRLIPESQRARMRRRAGNSRSKRKADGRLTMLGDQTNVAQDNRRPGQRI